MSNEQVAFVSQSLSAIDILLSGIQDTSFIIKENGIATSSSSSLHILFD